MDMVWYMLFGLGVFLLLFLPAIIKNIKDQF